MMQDVYQTMGIMVYSLLWVVQDLCHQRVGGSEAAAGCAFEGHDEDEGFSIVWGDWGV